METPTRVSPEEARNRIKSGAALLVCAYDSNEKFDELHLEGAISLNEFNSRLSSVPKEQEVIFYCA